MSQTLSTSEPETIAAPAHVAVNWRELWKLAAIVAAFAAFYFLPTASPRFEGAVTESLQMTREYAREHVLLCLVPALFIAGAIGVFVSQASVMRYLGPTSPKPLAYGVASISGSVLAVCSCTVLPLFAGIWRMGAGLGPASAFLYAGPAINVMAIIMTARILGLELGIARGVAAVLFSIIIGLLMHLIFRREESEKAKIAAQMPEEPAARPLWQTAIFFCLMIGILIFANWAPPKTQSAIWETIYLAKWWVTGALAALLALVLAKWFAVAWWKVLASAAAVTACALLLPSVPLAAFTAGVICLTLITGTSTGELGEWFSSTWIFTKQIVPLLFIGVLVAGFLLGRPGYEGIIPSRWVTTAVGGNSPDANLFASVAGAFMYFATLTEVPILQGLMGSGMGKGPALALLLAGPALSLPSMLVLRGIMGIRKTVVYVTLVIVMAALSGMIYGAM